MARYALDTMQRPVATDSAGSVSTQVTEASADSALLLPAKALSMVPFTQVNSARLTLVRLFTDFSETRNEAVHSAFAEVKSALRTVREHLPEVWAIYKSKGKSQVLVVHTQAQTLLSEKISKQSVKALILELAAVLSCAKHSAKEATVKMEAPKKRSWSAANLLQIIDAAGDTEAPLKQALKSQLKEAAHKLFRAS